MTTNKTQKQPTNLLDRDRKRVWHPYTQHRTDPEPLPVISAQGSTITLEDGRTILDAISSWWVNILGHAQPDISKAIAHQAHTLEHVMFAGFTHEPGVAIAEHLIEACHQRELPLDRVFFSDNGSTAVEVALKMAYQSFLNRGESRPRLLALHQSYHGDTLGAMALSEPEGFHQMFQPLMPKVDFVHPGDINELKNTLEAHPKQYSCMIVEPLVQGAGGMRMYSADYLSQLAALLKDHGVLLIADEIFTGFYRTGTLFAFEQAGIKPDLVCLSKGLTGGFLPMALTLAGESMFEIFLGPDKSNAFLHGHSYTGNPLACAAALASWEVLHRPETQTRIKILSEKTATHIQRLSAHPLVKNARSLGTIGALDITWQDEGSGTQGTYFAGLGPRLARAALEKGVLLRPLGNVLYAVPPFCTTDDQLDTIYRTMEDLLDELAESTKT